MLSLMFKLKGKVRRQNELSLGALQGPSAAWSGAVAAVNGDLRVSTGEGDAGTVCRAKRLHPRPVLCRDGTSRTPVMSTLTARERHERAGAAAEDVPLPEPKSDRTAVSRHLLSHSD